jgi:hypothetical protein
VIWGALTSTIAQKFFTNPGRIEYDTIGDALGNQGANISSFFPQIDGKTYLPVFENNTRTWKTESGEQKGDEEMMHFLICGASSNATNPNQMATESVSLHETDLISPFLNTGDEKKKYPVRFTGHATLCETINVGDKRIVFDETLLSEVFSELRLGGGRKRGWGLVHTLKIKESKINQNLHCWNYNGKKVLKTPLPVDSNEFKDTKISGRAFLAVYREYDKKGGKGYGRAFSKAQLSWDVGTVYG